MFFVCQGLILCKALKARKDAEDESTQIAFGNLRLEVITLQNEALEKDKILLYLVERFKTSEARLASLSEVEQKMEKFEKKKEADAKSIADLEYGPSIQVGLHWSEVEGLEKKLDEITENFNIEQEKPEISDTEWMRVQKNVDELRQVLGRRQRRHPSLEAFAAVVGPTEIKRAGTPFAPYDIRWRPATRSSHRAAPSSSEAHVWSGPL
jgi:hypothetical protein